MDPISSSLSGDALRFLKPSPAPTPTEASHAARAQTGAAAVHHTQAAQAVARTSDQTGLQEDDSSTANTEDVDKALHQINDFMQSDHKELRFVKNDETEGRMVIQIVNPQTNEVVGQIPDKAAIRLAASLDELNGHLFKGRA